MDKKKEDKKKPVSDLKKTIANINAKALERKVKRDAERAAANQLRRKKMSSKPMSKGSSIKGLQGLQTRLGSKITK